ncbi:hypothetical protein JB92DRAFT_1633325 [Gautieria morchelliformis]|nr:hypothetical protein JB92DRAFT_1633325 [Gautieria morchelliformis]
MRQVSETVKWHGYKADAECNTRICVHYYCANLFSFSMKVRRRLTRCLRRLARLGECGVVCTYYDWRRTPLVDVVKTNSFSSTLPYTPPTNTTSRQHDHTTQTQCQRSSPPSRAVFHLMPQQRTPTTTLPNDATEIWDDDFEFQSNRSSRSSKKHNHKSTSSTLPPPHAHDEESWDDAYEDENAPVQRTRDIKPSSKPDTDGEMRSWGSGSDWSGDGDAEDLSHESYAGVASEPPERPSLSSASRSSHLRLSNSSIQSPTPNAASAASAPGTPSSPSSLSFFSKMSPVRRWKVHEADETPKVTSKENPGAKKAAWEKKLRSSSQKPPTPVQRTDSSIHIGTMTSQRNEPPSLTRVFSGASPSVATQPPGQSSQTLLQSSISPGSLLLLLALRISPSLPYH